MRFAYYLRCLVLLFPALMHAHTVLSHNQHPLGKQQLDWQVDTNISRTLTMNFDFHAGGSFVSWRQPGKVEEREGYQCLVGPYFFFDVDERFAFDIDEPILLELLFDRSKTDGFSISYDHSVNPRAKTIHFDPDHKRRWERVTVRLEHARFANRKYEKTDFSIGALGAIHPPNSAVNGELALCDLKITREQPGEPVFQQGLLELEVRNEHGSPDSARVGLYDPQGRSPLPSGDALILDRFSEQVRQLPMLSKVKGWSSEGRYVFYVDGSYQARMPAGSYDLLVYKGPEYRITHQKIDIEAGKSTRLKLKLKRWVNMPDKDWYSGDGHIHIARPNPSVNEKILAYTRAEDIHVSNLVQMANVANDHYPQYAFGSAGQFIGSKHALVPGQESPRTSHRGHTLGLNAKAFHLPEEDYFLYDKTADLIHRDGGLFGYAHVALDAFRVSNGLALDVPLGSVDFLEMLQMGILNSGYLYDFLNLGFKLLPAAGSDYPYIKIAGSERIYVNLTGKFSPQAWFDAWRDNRSFVSNGPMLEFAVNGDTGNVEFDLERGDKVTISAKGAVNPDFDLLEKIELVVHGEVVETVTSDSGSESLTLSYDFQPRNSLWLAIRVYGKENTVAHTAPVYLYIDGNRRFWNPGLAADIAKKYIGLLRAFKVSTPDLNEDWERFETEDFIIPKWNAAKAELVKRIDRAIGVYEKLLRDAATASY